MAMPLDTKEDRVVFSNEGRESSGLGHVATNGQMAALSAYRRALTEMDADALAGRFAGGGAFRFSGGAPLCGRAAIRAAFVRLFAAACRVELHPVALFQGDGVAVDESDMEITLDDGTHAAIPATTTFWMTGDLIASCRLITDPESILTRAMSGIPTSSTRQEERERGWSMQRSPKI